MRCPTCYCKLERDASFCSHCGQKIEENASEQTYGKKFISLTGKQKKTLMFIFFWLVLIFYFFIIRCNAVICPMPSGLMSDYCIIHRCSIGDCTNKKAKNYNFCYTHLPSESYTYTPEVAKSVLDFSGISVTHNSSYTVCTGTITNNGNRTYSFVEVKGTFKDSSGKVLETDWTYAVGSEGLAPGESSSFRMSVKKNTSIRKCDIEIIDYDR